MPSSKFSKMHGHNAYLIAYLDIEKLPIVVKRIHIASEDGDSITHILNKEFTVTIYETEGSNYQEAHDKMMEAIENNPMLKWVLPYVDTDNEAVYNKVMKYVDSIPSPFALIFGDENNEN